LNSEFGVGFFPLPFVVAVLLGISEHGSVAKIGVGDSGFESCMDFLKVDVLY